MTLPYRFWSKVKKTSTCWLWTAALNASGYGWFSYEGSQKLAHRLAWTERHGPVPDGLVLDHLCRVRRCVNPDHLRAVTRGENNTAPGSLSQSAINKAKSSCPRGHPLVSDNRGYRGCPSCAAATAWAWRERQKGLIVSDTDIQSYADRKAGH